MLSFLFALVLLQDGISDKKGTKLRAKIGDESLHKSHLRIQMCYMLILAYEVKYLDR